MKFLVLPLLTEGSYRTKTEQERCDFSGLWCKFKACSGLETGTDECFTTKR